ncbi:MAG: hypothetical protein CMH54_13645 [Myxococcales bacterium]|nr:hypothetical protein [Myxococcales bacterium]
MKILRIGFLAGILLCWGCGGSDSGQGGEVVSDASSDGTSDSSVSDGGVDVQTDGSPELPTVDAANDTATGSDATTGSDTGQGADAATDGTAGEPDDVVPGDSSATDVASTDSGGDAGSCTPDCSGKMCGPNGCGGSCGFCVTGSSCSDFGQCIPDTVCLPNCSLVLCGPDGCGGSCGDCSVAQQCEDGFCRCQQPNFVGVACDECAPGTSGPDCTTEITDACPLDGFTPLKEEAVFNPPFMTYFAHSALELPRDEILLEILPGAPFFGPVQPGTYNLAGTNYADCGLCLQAAQNCTVQCETDFYADEGLVHLTSLWADTGTFAGSFEGVVFREVTIDATTLVSTPVPGGKTWCMDGYSFFCINGDCNVTPGCQPYCGSKTCGSDGCGGSCGACIEGSACNENTGSCAPMPMNGSLIVSYNFAQPQSSFQDCHATYSLSPEGVPLGGCDECSFVWRVKMTELQETCGNWFQGPAGTYTSLGVNTTDDSLWINYEDGTGWGKFSGEGLVNNTAYGGQLVLDGIFIDMNGNQEYDDFEDVVYGEIFLLSWMGLSTVCGNGVCELAESHTACPADCGATDVVTPFLGGTLIDSFVFDEPEPGFVDCEVTYNLSPISVGPDDCESCHYTWTIAVQKLLDGCGSWLQDVDGTQFDVGLNLLNGDLWLRQGTGTWNQWPGSGTMIDDAFLGQNYGMSISVDKNGDGVYTPNENVEQSQSFLLHW